MTVDVGDESVEPVNVPDCVERCSVLSWSGYWDPSPAERWYLPTVGRPGRRDLAYLTAAGWSTWEILQIDGRSPAASPSCQRPRWRVSDSPWLLQVIFPKFSFKNTRQLDCGCRVFWAETQLDAKLQRARSNVALSGLVTWKRKQAIVLQCDGKKFEFQAETAALVIACQGTWTICSIGRQGVPHIELKALCHWSTSLQMLEWISGRFKWKRGESKNVGVTHRLCHKKRARRGKKNNSCFYNH